MNMETRDVRTFLAIILCAISVTMITVLVTRFIVDGRTPYYTVVEKHDCE